MSKKMLLIDATCQLFVPDQLNTVRLSQYGINASGKDLSISILTKLQPRDQYLGHLSCMPSLEASITAVQCTGTNKNFVGIPRNNVISHVSLCSNLKSDKYWDKGAVSVWKRRCWLPVFRDEGVLEALGLPSPLFRFSMRNPWSWWHVMASDASQTVNQTCQKLAS